MCWFGCSIEKTREKKQISWEKFLKPYPGYVIRRHAHFEGEKGLVINQPLLPISKCPVNLIIWC